MIRRAACGLFALWLALAVMPAAGQPSKNAEAWPPKGQVVDIPTRPGVTVRTLILDPSSPTQPSATLVLLAGGTGGLQISSDGDFGWGKGNFLVRSRQRFANQGFRVVVVDAPSDRPPPMSLFRFRQTAEHVADLAAVMAWLRQRSPLPVWLVGTSRGTESAAYAAAMLDGSKGPDGIVLTSTILSDPKGVPVTAMPLSRIRVPVFVVHHAHDGCPLCRPGELPDLMRRLDASPRQALWIVDGGTSEGDPCEAHAHHGYNGVEAEVVARIADWVRGPAVAAEATPAPASR
jgi:pimeloyl-ACP methyl ester carboxylesterase